MKKLLVLLTAALLLLSGIASAESQTAEAQLYTSENANYSMMIPADFIPVNDSFVSMVESKIKNGDLPGVDSDQLARMQASLANVDLTQLDMILDSSLTGNINVQVQNIGIPGSMLPFVKTQLDASNLASYAAVGVDSENITTYDMEQIGHYTWYHLSCIMLEREIQQYIIADEDGLGYIVTFTGIEAPDIELMLSTFLFE